MCSLHLYSVPLRPIKRDQAGKDRRSGIRSDPNREDDPQYIVRLVGQVVHVSVETVKIVKALPAEFMDPEQPGPLPGDPAPVPTRRSGKRQTMGKMGL